MNFFQALNIQKGVTAVVGSGGKSSLLAALSQELRTLGTVVLCTTTKMYPTKRTYTMYSPTEEAVQAALSIFQVICIGALVEQGKLGPSELSMKKLCQLANYVLVEADGSKGLPLKAHLDFEPVIPKEANQTICVVGLSGIGKPISAAAHRWELYAKLAEADPVQPASPELAAKVLTAEHIGDQYYLNQADDEMTQVLGRRVQGLLTKPAIIGSLQKGIVLC